MSAGSQNVLISTEIYFILGFKCLWFFATIKWPKLANIELQCAVVVAVNHPQLILQAPIDRTSSLKMYHRLESPLLAEYPMNHWTDLMRLSVNLNCMSAAD